MNRYKKEELRRQRKARAGLTAEEIAKVDREDAKKSAFEEKVNNLHLKLFPEEYDFIYDSGADAKDRKQGINPMSADYIATTNKRRNDIGFADFGGQNNTLPHDTRGWIVQMLTDGKDQELETLFEKYFGHDDIN